MIPEVRRGQHAVPAWVWWLGTALVLVYMAVENWPIEGRHTAKDWRFFFYAAEAIRNGTDLYDSGSGGYIYPPLLAWLISPLVPLGFFDSARVWLCVSVAGLFLALLLPAREVSRRIPDAWSPARPAATVFVGLLLSINVARRELEHTQTDWITVLGFVLGMLWMDRRPLAAGAALGIAANVKYHTLIVVPYLILRGRFKAAAATMAFSVAGALLPAITIGWDRNLEYLGRAFGGLTQFVGIETERRANVWEIHNLDSISITSAFSRASHALGQDTAMTLAMVAAAAGACVALAWWMYSMHGTAFLPWLSGLSGSGRVSSPETGNPDPRRPGPLVNAAEWAGLIVATVAFSPQTLKRHMFLMVPVYVMLAAILLARRVGPGPHPRKWMLLAGAAVSMAALFLPIRIRAEQIMDASNAWRAVGGASWGLLVLFFALLWTALEWERAGARPRAALER